MRGDHLGPPVGEHDLVTAPQQGEVERGGCPDTSGSPDDRHLHAGRSWSQPLSRGEKSNDLCSVSCRACLPQTVREATFDVWREYGLTTIFANPGSTEIQLLADLPDDLRFVLGLHESSVVGMATGWAIGRGEPALAILHTTAGLGNAVGALATARVNRAPLVVLVGQQDRRHLAFEPFLAGRLHGLAGEYPVWVDQPVRPQDVPGRSRARATRRSPRAGRRS